MSSKLFPAALAFVFVFVFGPAQTASRAVGFDRMNEALINVLESARQLNIIGDYGFDNQCLYGYRLRVGGEQPLVRSFERGDYLILGAADSRVDDLDLAVFTEDGHERPLAVDVDDDARPVLRLRVEADARLRICIRNQASDGPAFAVFLILVRKPGGNFDLLSLAEAVDNTSTLARLHKLFGATIPQDNVVLFGGEISPDVGGRTMVFNLRYGRGRFVACSSSSESAEELDLRVTNQYRANDPRGTLVASCNDLHNLPFCEFSATDDPDSYTCIETRNIWPTGANPFVFTFVLQR